MLRMGSGEPLVLLHGIMGSERMWADVAPLLASDYDVIALTAYGHCGGEAMRKHPGRYGDVVAGTVRQLDELGIERAHLVGNSMGGWMALDLARRGRALSVFAISPAGFWPPPVRGVGRPARRLKEALRAGRRARPLLPLLYRSPRVREFAFRAFAVHGERLSPAVALATTDDMLNCAIAEDMLQTDEYLAPIDPPPCPITITWAELDRVLPERKYAPVARERIPGARFEILPGVGHVPMFDDPKLVADAIRDSLSSPQRSGMPQDSTSAERAPESTRA